MFERLAPADGYGEEPTEAAVEADVLDLGPVRVARVSRSPFQPVRIPSLIPACDPGTYQLWLNLVGGVDVTQVHGPAQSARVTELVLYDGSQPSHTWTPAGHARAEAVGTAFPGALLPLRRDQVRTLIAVSVTCTDGIASLLGQFLLGLTRAAAHAGPADRARLATILLDLLAAALAQHLDADRSGPPDTRRGELLARIHAFIQQRLDDPALSPATIAAAHHISTRYLHMLFRSQGATVGRWVRGRRLDRCRQELADPLRQRQPVHEIAARWGFPSAAHFSRAFRAAYDLSPTEYRQLAQRS